LFIIIISIIVIIAIIAITFPVAAGTARARRAGIFAQCPVCAAAALASFIATPHGPQRGARGERLDGDRCLNDANNNDANNDTIGNFTTVNVTIIVIVARFSSITATRGYPGAGTTITRVRISASTCAVINLARCASASDPPHPAAVGARALLEL
jgi:hypothetical protein